MTSAQPNVSNGPPHPPLKARPDPIARRGRRDLRRLEDPDGVAEGVADAHVGAVEVVGGLLGDVGDATRLEVSYRARQSSERRGAGRSR